VRGSLDGVLVYDSQSGPVGAVRFDSAAGWRQFSLIREIQQSGEFTITMSLTGMGEVLFDDLRIVPHDPRGSVVAESADAENAGSQSGPLDLFRRIPRLRFPRR
jgi:hypothetical protein